MPEPCPAAAAGGWRLAGRPRQPWLHHARSRLVAWSHAGAPCPPLAAPCPALGAQAGAWQEARRREAGGEALTVSHVVKVPWLSLVAHESSITELYCSVMELYCSAEAVQGSSSAMGQVTRDERGAAACVAARLPSRARCAE